MPRARRITWLNYPHLVIAQANGGTSLFSDEDDYNNYLACLRQMVRDRLLKVYAYCLLEKQLRLVVLPNRLMLSKIIQRLHTRHTARMNRKLMRTGHLFSGRFKSLLFDRCDLIDVVRSVHLWPVRQGLLRRAELYPYSSHGFYMDFTAQADFLSTADVFDNFSGSLEKQRRAFGRFVEALALNADDFGVDEIVPGIGANTKHPQELLSKAQVTNKRPKKSSVKILADRTILLHNISFDHLISDCRRQDLVMARRLLATAAVIGAGRSITEVAAFLHRDKATVSRLVAQGLDLLSSDEAFSHMFDAMRARGGPIIAHN